MTQPSGNYQPNPNQPPSYPSPEQGAYASYAQAYGQGLPSHMDQPQQPAQMKTLSLLVYLNLGVSLISSLLSLLYLSEIEQGMVAALGNFMGEPAITSSDMDLYASSGFGPGMNAALTLVSVLINIGLTLLCLYFMKKGKNWGRIVLTIFAALNLLGFLSVFLWIFYFHWTYLLTLLTLGLSIAFLLIAWRRPISEYMRQVAAYQQWTLQRAYLGLDQKQ